MRLVIDGRRLTAKRTGVGRYLESLLLEWTASGLPLEETIVVLQDPNGISRIPPCHGLTAVVIGTNWPGLLWERFGLGRVLQAGDLLFAPANLIPGSWRGSTVLVVHDTIQEVLPSAFPWHVRWRFSRRYRNAANQAQTILVPSQATARDVLRIYGIDADRIRVVAPTANPGLRPLPSDDPLIRAARDACGLRDDPYFLFVGKRSRRRNVPIVLEAFSVHRRTQPSHRLVFVGPKSGQDQPALSDDEEHTHVAGHVSESILHGLYAGAIGLLYPSEYEGFGLPVLEAMACGCPVVTLRNSALLESAGDAALFLESADRSSLVDAMHGLFTDKNRRAEHITRGLAHAANFSRASFAEQVKAELAAAAATSAQTTKVVSGARAEAASGSL